MTDAQTEARLRAALERLIGSSEAFLKYFNPFNLASDKENQWYSVNEEIARAKAALSAHTHASDCDKQEPIPAGYGEYTPITVGGSTSDRTADVTVEELAERIYNAAPAHTASSGRKIPWKELNPTIADGHRKEARALLDAYGMWRR